MKQSEAVKRLSHFDQQGRYVFSTRDMARVFSGESSRSREATLKRLSEAGILERPSKGVYVYALSRHKGPDTLELIARTLRRGAYNYVSLESSLSEYGVISQVPVGRLTVMTTGRKGEYRTPYGVIEFTHTRRGVSDILASTQMRQRPLRVATPNTALRDIKRVGRNTHLIDERALHDD
ncbi:type IV toxin-antitoxin system AbiEi family antitoxin [Vreelandella malpeensis]|uniref:Type IV toxin-antitoxin system AbiEi family antitoxin domain-containing protein n=1 Tax=Vreelandella malpeensis TaxID=1172368 RepID=A0ABS8DPC6_9GAMM|nr:type IV toxin-antitoxin system AbiEi family antitoxin domain-containing protein [Halomonas malpeensis]MCB8888153.1 type IV toxin-antitoxin system AbiEi family antitoxin domain-containing protein [Halomonas malpeensis]